MRHNGRLVWFAVMRDNNDNDWSFGTFRRRDAVAIARRWRLEGYPAYIAMIDPIDSFCIGEIRDF